MSKLTGVFDYFIDLDRIPVTDIARWIKRGDQVKSLENFIGNRILYPQTISITLADLDTDFAILREFVKNQPSVFFNNVSRRIIISGDILVRFPPPSRFIETLVESLSLQGINAIFLKNEKGLLLIGSVITAKNLPNFASISKKTTVINVSINGLVSNLSLGSINLLPARERHLRVKIESLDEVLAAGGELGLVIDLR